MLTFIERLVQAIVGRARFDTHIERMLEKDFLEAMEQKARSGCPNEREIGLKGLKSLKSISTSVPPPSPPPSAGSITPLSLISHETSIRRNLIEEGFEELLGPLTFNEFLSAPRELSQRKEAKARQDAKHEPEHLRHPIGFTDYGFTGRIRIPRRRNIMRSSLEALEPLWSVKKPSKIARAQHQPSKEKELQILTYPQRMIEQQQLRLTSAPPRSHPSAEQKPAKEQKSHSRSRLAHPKQKTTSPTRQQRSAAKPELVKHQLPYPSLNHNSPLCQQQQFYHPLPTPPQSQPHAPPHQHQQCKNRPSRAENIQAIAIAIQKRKDQQGHGLPV